MPPVGDDALGHAGHRLRARRRARGRGSHTLDRRRCRERARERRGSRRMTPRQRPRGHRTHRPTASARRPCSASELCAVTPAHRHAFTVRCLRRLHATATRGPVDARADDPGVAIGHDESGVHASPTRVGARATHVRSGVPMGRRRQSRSARARSRDRGPGALLRSGARVARPPRQAFSAACIRTSRAGGSARVRRRRRRSSGRRSSARSARATLQARASPATSRGCATPASGPRRGRPLGRRA